MSSQRYNLKPFDSSSSPSFSVYADLEFEAEGLKLIYVVMGPMENLRIPAAADSPQRKDGLWDAMCCEFFVGTKESKKYWEFNFSPSRHWQAYEFSGYREGRQDAASAVVDIDRYQSKTHFEMIVRMSGLSIFEKPKLLEGSVTLILESVTGEKTFWAIEHRAKLPDFHRRDSFISFKRSLLSF